MFCGADQYQLARLSWSTPCSCTTVGGRPCGPDRWRGNKVFVKKKVKEKTRIVTLCAGCRAAVCSTTPISIRGCARWNEVVEDKEFIFGCPECTIRLKLPGKVGVLGLHVYAIRKLNPPLQIQLREPYKVPKKWEMLFRLDPAALILAVRWHETHISFGKMLRDLLVISYKGDEGSVSTPHPNTGHTP